PHSNNNDDPIHLRQAFDVEPELAVDKLEIFPNPFSDYLTISGEWVGNTDLEMSLISMDGRSEDLASIQRLEESGVGQAFKYRLSKSGLPSGIYILHVKSGGKLISSRKIVKK
ncbi:MAG: T9SS type A sorting domain-containing protein, partial [Bacteroidia bacterium]|nr:T9SS type A sorting domain-containing protein [Bacteroidia bacterium]